MSTAFAKDDKNPLKQLIEAENRAKENIAREETARLNMMQKAETDAENIYFELGKKEEEKFQQAVRESEGLGDEAVRAKLESIEKEKEQQLASYNAAKDGVIDLLLHHVTTCHVELDESQRQAFLQIKRQKELASVKSDDY